MRRAEDEGRQAGQQQQELSDAVAVDVYDQVYHLRGPDPAYIEELAAAVDGKMRAVAALGGTVDSLRVAVLAALNIADELASLRHRYDELAGSLSQTQRTVRSRAGSLSHMLDEAMEETGAEDLLATRPDQRRAG